MTADTLSAEQKQDVRYFLRGLAEFGGMVHFSREEASYLYSILATPELLALGEAAVSFQATDPRDVLDDTTARLNLLQAARAYAASVASIPSTKVGDNRT